MGKYIIAKRLNSTNPKSEAEIVAGVPDITLRGTTGMGRMLVDISEETADELRKQFGKDLIVEVETYFFPQGVPQA